MIHYDKVVVNSNKIEKYQRHIGSGNAFYPFAVEQGGRLGPSAIKYLKLIASKLDNNRGFPTWYYWYCFVPRIGAAVARGNHVKYGIYRRKLGQALPNLAYNEPLPMNPPKWVNGSTSFRKVAQEVLTREGAEDFRIELQDKARTQAGHETRAWPASLRQ